MTAAGALDTSPSSVARAPRRELRRSTCRGCDDEILIVAGVVLEVRELVPTHRCPKCNGTGAIGPRTYRRECPRCYGLKMLGEEIPAEEVLYGLDAWGCLRALFLADRMRGEALHREHHCTRR